MRRLFVMVPVLGSLFVAREAHAQVAFDWEVSGSATLGFTDNVVNTPEPGPDATDQTPQPEADGFGTVSPAIRLQFETPKATQTLSYNFGYSFYFIHTDANSFSNSLGYGLRAPTSATSELTFALSGSQSTVQQLALLGTAAGGTAQPTPGTQPDGTDILVTAGVGQGFSAELTDTVRFTQAIQGTVGRTIVADADDTDTYVGSLGFGIVKAFSRDTISVDQGNDVQYTPAIVQGEVTTAEVAQVLHRARLTWGHAFSEEWSSQLGAGVVLGYDVLRLTTPVPHPTGVAGINWQGGTGAFGINYSHDATPSVLLRQILAIDNLAITGLVRLPSGFDIGGTAGAQITRTLLTEDGLGAPGMSILTDLALGWVPSKAPVRIEARYQFSRQFPLGDGAEADLFPTIQRHTGLLSTTFSYPGAPVAGGAAPFVALPPPTANPDIVGQQAPRSQRALADEEKALQDELRGKKDGAEGE